MRIKRIDLVGFKSFCDKTSVNLQRPITGVVGPNGCGKSNIVDALRWAMGEQSAKHLRGKAMADVIFNGSDSRGPSGTAEIAITFENDGRVPAEYLGYSEITITRRLHRDGTSEYQINKVPVRLRDVTNLFLGTGVGTKAYSIIEQGRVGLIVSAKPEDRRLFIEEAAGITKYRKRKQTAERKMESTRQNLLRVSDILDELGKRQGSLRRQAKKAERYREYSGEMRDIELCAATHRLLELEVNRQVAQKALSELGQRSEDSSRELATAEAQIETKRLECSGVEQQINEAQERLYQIDNRIKLTESEIEYHGREAEDLKRRAEQSHGEIAQLSKQLEDLTEQVAEMEREANALKGQRQVLADRLTEREAEVLQLEQSFAAVETELDTERSRQGAAQRILDRGDASLQGIAERREQVEHRIERLNAEMRKATDRQAELGANSSQLDQELHGLRSNMSELSSQREQAEARLTELTEGVARSETELEVMRTELHRRRSRLTSLKEIQERYEGYGEGTREIMQRYNGTSQQNGILGLVAEAIDAPSDYETALAAVLGRRLGTVIVSEREVGRDAISYLKEHQKGRSSFIARNDATHLSDEAAAPVGLSWPPAVATGEATWSDGGGELQAAPSEPPPGVHGPMLGLVNCTENEHRPIAERLLSDIVVVENLDRAMTVWDEAADKTLVTLDGEILEPDGTFTGGSGSAELGGVLRQRREIKELTEIVGDLETQYDELMEQHVAVKSEIASLRQTLDAVTAERHHSDKEAVSRERDLNSISAELAALIERRSDLESEFGTLSAAGERLNDDEAQIRRDLEQAGEDVAVAGERSTQLSTDREQLGEQLSVARGALSDLRVELAQAETAVEGMERNLGQLQQRRDEAQQRIVALDRGSAEGLARAAQLREDAEAKRSQLSEMIAERASSEDSLSEQRSCYEELMCAIGETEVNLKQLRSRVQELREAISQKQLRQHELQLGREHLKEQIAERYNEDIERVAGDYHLRAPVTDDQLKRMDQLKELIRRMGEINLTAIDEFKEINARYEFLARQKDDLESALKQLTRAIQKINRTCRERFKETFDAVNERFQQVFPRLFNGGKAQLLLTAADDILEGGVDIIAQPPGKKLQSLEMMSGGEKALTAVSLIFAMFMVKPTPFCLLDEVDAPLDDANVVRFREMVRDMADTCQFIVITHNRVTMEIADSLFGVTMEEPGISKMVSVNLSEAQAVVA